MANTMYFETIQQMLLNQVREPKRRVPVRRQQAMAAERR
jgi:hypothetical protein